MLDRKKLTGKTFLIDSSLSLWEIFMLNLKLFDGLILQALKVEQNGIRAH